VQVILKGRKKMVNLNGTPVLIDTKIFDSPYQTEMASGTIFITLAGAAYLTLLH
jgi:hypothetical protein